VELSGVISRKNAVSTVKKLLERMTIAFRCLKYGRTLKNGAAKRQIDFLQLIQLLLK